jgi:hypothetical protein
MLAKRTAKNQITIPKKVLEKHLLELDLPQLPILTPGQFLERLKP